MGEPSSHFANSIAPHYSLVYRWNMKHDTKSKIQGYRQITFDVEYGTCIRLHTVHEAGVTPTQESMPWPCWT